MTDLKGVLIAQNKQLLDALQQNKDMIQQTITGTQTRPITEETAAETTIARNEAQHYKELYEQLKAANDLLEKGELKEDKHTLPSVDEAVAYLQIRAVGKRIDETYETYCGAILGQYLAKRKHVHILVERAIVNRALEMHICSIRPNALNYTERRLAPRSIFVAILKLIITGLAIKQLLSLF